MRFFIVAVIYLIAFCKGGYDYDDRSKWIDPSDMLNYDASTQKMKKPREDSVSDSLAKDQGAQQNIPNVQFDSAAFGDSLVKLYDHMTQTFPENKDVFVQTVKKYISEYVCEKQIQSTKESSELPKCQADRKELRQELRNVKDEQRSESDSLEKTYFKQYVRTLLQHYSRSVADGSFLLYNTEVLLNYDDIIILERFAISDHGNVQDAHEVLSRMIQHVQLVEAGDAGDWHESIIEHYKEYLVVTLQIVAVLTLASVAIALQVRLHLSWRQLVIKVLVLLFLISIPWNWWHMYKLAVAKRQAEAAKDLPIECRPEKQTASQSFWTALRNTFTLNTDKCAEYYEKMLVDPAYEVAPTQALAVTVSKFFVEPLEHIGQAIGKLIHGTLKELPVQIWPFALAFICLMSLFILTLVFGYRIKLFYLFGIEPGKRTPQPSVKDSEQHKQLQDRIQDLTCKLEKLTFAQSHPAIQETPVPPVVSLFSSELVSTTKIVRQDSPLIKSIECASTDSELDIKLNKDDSEDIQCILTETTTTDVISVVDNKDVKIDETGSCTSYNDTKEECILETPLKDDRLSNRVDGASTLNQKDPVDFRRVKSEAANHQLASEQIDSALDLTLSKEGCNGQTQLLSVENLGAGDSLDNAKE